jgi:hypothetical protein
VALGVVNHQLLNQLVRSDFRRDVVQQVDGEVTKVRVADGSARVTSNISGLKHRILNRAGGGEECELRVLDGHDAIIVGLEVQPTKSTQLKLLD